MENTHTPLNDNQMGIYLECLDNEQSLRYNVCFEYTFDKETDAQKLVRACDTVLAHYASLSCGITLEFGAPELVLLDKAPATQYMKVADSEYASLVSNYMRPFVLDKQPLCHLTVFETEKAIYLVAEIHHLITDGTSFNIFERALEAAYNGQEIPEEGHSVFDAYNEARSAERGNEMEAHYDYFDHLLAGVETDSNILSDRTDSDLTHCGTLHYDLDIPAQNVKALANANGVTENVVLLSAFAYALAKYTGQNESLFTSINNGRRGKPLHNTTGFFVRTFPLYFQIDEESSINDFLVSVKKKYVETMSHDDASFVKLAERYGVRSDIKYVYQGSNIFGNVNFNGKVVKKRYFDCNDAISNLDIMISETGDSYHCNLKYRIGLYSEANILGFLKLYSNIIKGMLSKQYLKEIVLVSEEEERMIADFNTTEAPYDQSQTVWDILKEHILNNSHKIAVKYKSNEVTYAQFDRLTAKIAAHLTSKGIGREDFVPILIPRNEYMPIIAWGVVRAGAAYQPLDPTYPQERLNFMVKDTGPKILIADRSLRNLLQDYDGDILYTDEIEALPETDFQPKDTPESAMVIIYTSGTTGTPKGCVLENRNIVCFHHNHTRNMGLDEHSRVATYASFGFDAGIMDIFTTLMAGGSLFIIPDEIRLDIPRINDFYKEHGITFGFITTQVGRMFAECTDCQSLRTLLVGGEKLVPFTPPTDFRFINGYGPSETIAYVCHHHVTDDSIIQPIGVPSGNTKLYVVDKNGRLLPAGACGELCIAGQQVGRGYLNRPEKTAESFTTNPFCSEPGYERIYKTGDIVRLLPSGEIDFVGRRDAQVKIRGFRVELTEIEEIIRRYDNITDATVVAYDEPGGGKYIAAYIVSKQKIDICKLNEFILGEKPSYMVPAVTMQIASIPYTPNQKVNKRALPIPQREIDTSTLQKPENQTQQQIYDIARQILGHDAFGITSDLFEAGLTSIGTLKLNVELGRKYNKAIKIADLKEHPTIQQLETFLTKGENSITYEKQSEYPLLQNQLGVLVDCNMHHDSILYNIPVLFKLSPSVDVEKLRQAITTAINAHPYLKTTLKADSDGQTLACRNDELEAVVECFQIQELPNSKQLIRSFNLYGERLYRAQIFSTACGNYLFLDTHHLISDGTSLNILIQDINLSYQGEMIETEIITGFEAALEEERARQSEKYAESDKYYNILLSGCDTNCLPGKCPETANSTNGVTSTTFTLDAVSAQIIDYCKANNISFNAFFNAVFSYTLSRFLHSDNVTYCTIYNGRNDSRLAQSFAMLVKTLPVCSFLNPTDNTLDFIKRMQRQLLDSMTNDIVSFAELSNKYGLKSDIFFNYQGDNFEFGTIGGEKAERMDLEFAVAKAPLVIDIILKDSIFKAEVTYRTDYFCKEFIRSFIDSLGMAAERFTVSEHLHQISIFSENERRFFDQMNATEIPIEDIPTQRLIERWAEKAPDRIAVKTLTASITFAKLDTLANKVANELVRLGVMADDIIGMILDRTVFVPVVEIGILKAGGAFLPMLPTYPDNRLDFCLRDADCKFAIVTRDIAEKRKELFSDDKPYKVLVLEDLIASGEITQPKVDFRPNQLAYCIYTSGSTGTPKGVMIEQHSFTNFVQTSPLKQISDTGNSLFCISSISFDMSICEIFFFLCQGKTLYIASEEEIHDFDKLFAAFKTNDIDLAVMTPSLAWNLLSIPEFGKIMANVKGIMLGAEAFQPALYTKIKDMNPDIAVQNGYGPTECTQGCAFKTLTSSENITIGGPFPNSKFYVMDDCGHLLPRYAMGELMICGECVGRGYVKLPEKTAAAFTQVEGIVAYHSGDLVRINRDGEVEFGGRADNQVKLRGFRVELGEIESVMQDFPGITQAKVIVRNNGTEDFLAGFFIAEKQVSIDELANFLKKKLTYYMVPTAMMQLDKMPMTPNGKLDKKSLPEIHPVRKEKVKRAPKKSLEEKILDIFRSVLNIEECYVDDNFFEVGGTSLSASKVVMQLKGEGHSIEYQDIFDHQTAEDLAVFLESRKGPAAHSTQEQTSGNDFLTSQNADLQSVLQYNTIEHSSEVKRHPLGDVLLTGATGFLGNHVLRELIKHETGKIYCLMRKGEFDDLATRLKSMLFYYFEDRCEEAFENRIVMIEGDITEDNLSSKFTDIHFDTLINCAACVKHYANDNSIERVNVLGVKKLIALNKEKNATMVQISTTSIPGAHTEETYRVNVTMPEDKLFVIENMNNQYVISKYKAELLMFHAIKDGMRGKVIRVGNLMGRYSDGEFQTNLRSNAFLNALKGFVAIGKCPYSHATDPMSFSPIDSTAKAVVLLAGTNDQFTAFNADSRFTFDEMKLINVTNHCGITIQPVDDEEYYNDFYRMMANQEQNKKVAALLTNDRPDLHLVCTDNRFTANVLYRLGFLWPFIDDNYLEKVIEALDGLGFFWFD